MAELGFVLGRHPAAGESNKIARNQTDLLRALTTVTCGAERGEHPMQKFDELSAGSLRKDIPPFRTGDNIKVHVKVIEGSRSRVQVFQGVVTARAGNGIGETYTVRKISFGVGVERQFPVHSPIIEKVEVVSRGDVRRAKLYYLRDLTGKASKIKERRGERNADLAILNAMQAEREHEAAVEAQKAAEAEAAEAQAKAEAEAAAAAAAKAEAEAAAAAPVEVVAEAADAPTEAVADESTSNQA